MDTMDSVEETNSHQLVDVIRSDFDEILFKRCYEEGYNLFDEPYIRWLLLHHPEAVKREWLVKFLHHQKSSVHLVKKLWKKWHTNEITLNYTTLYSAMKKADCWHKIWIDW